MMKLPEQLTRKAFRAGKEYAWARHDALEVIRLCRQHGWPIWGAEVWLPGPDGPIIPSPYFYSWTAPQRIVGESELEYALKTAEQCEEYISRFEWDPRDTVHSTKIPMFCLAFG